jgi:hypothetical protein
MSLCRRLQSPPLPLLPPPLPKAKDQLLQSRLLLRLRKRGFPLKKLWSLLQMFSLKAEL